jgi:predicted nucleotidyltransferase
MINLNSNPTAKILSYFFTNPAERIYGRKLAEALKVDPGNLSRKLIEWEKEGLLAAETEGRQKYFYLNKDYPFLFEIKKIHQAEFSLPQLLKKSLSKIKNLQAAYIFGSYGKNTFSRESDIDLLLIGDHGAREARRAVLPLQKKIGREINIIDFSESEFKRKKKQGDAFLKNIFSGKHIKLI